MRLLSRKQPTEPEQDPRLVAVQRQLQELEQAHKALEVTAQGTDPEAAEEARADLAENEQRQAGMRQWLRDRR